MKTIKLTQDYSVGTEVEVGTMQKIMWGGKELTVTSQETETEIIIQIDLLGWNNQ